jgi:hypothetical protein
MSPLLTDYSLILSIASVAIAVFTAIYLLGYKLGRIEARITELKDSSNRFEAQFSPSWHEEYGKVKALVDQLSRTNYERIITELISRIHSSLTEVVTEIMNQVSPRLNIKECEIYQETPIDLVHLADSSLLREITKIEEIKPSAKLFIRIRAIVDKSREIECVGLLDVDEKLVVRPKRTELTSLSFEYRDSIPVIRTDRQASLFTETSAEEIRGYLEGTVALLAAVISFMIVQQKGGKSPKK